MAISDILRNLTGGGGGQQGAAAVQLPAFGKQGQASLTGARKEIEGINKAIILRSPR